jgi:hypothetical protein
MLKFDAKPLAQANSADLPQHTCAVADTRAALTLLLELGMQIVDGDAAALLGIPPALARVLERLNDVHLLLGERALRATTPFFAVLAQHAEHRRDSDLRQLDALSEEVSEAQGADTIGRSVVVAALLLLANLESDERWYGSLQVCDDVPMAA